MNRTITKLTIIIAAAMLLSSTAYAAGVAINETGDQPVASAMLDVQSTSKGFLPPKMTEAQKNAIASPATGLMIYQTDGTAGIYVYDGSAWKQVDAGTVAITSGGTGTTTGSITGTTALTLAAGGTNQNVTLTPSGTGYTLLGGNVGIGTGAPAAKLHVYGTQTGAAWAGMGAFGGASNAVILGQYNDKAYLGAHNAALDTWADLLINPGGGNVGIGTTATPLSKISAVNNGFDATTNPGYKFYGHQSSPTATVPLFHIQTAWENNLTANVFKVNTYQNEAGFNILANGYVGIGTATPADSLQVGNLMFGGDVGREIYSTSGYDINYKATGASSHHFYTNGTEKFTIEKIGNIGIGTTTPTATLHVVGTTLASAWSTSSDYRLKNNIVDTHFGINDLMKIPVRDYTYKADADNTPTTGFIAQELYEIFPNAVTKPANAEDMWSVDYGKVTPLLVKGMQDLKAENDELKKELAVIKKALGL